jgi:hypothetical protein
VLQMDQPELQGNRHRVVLPQYGVIFEMRVKITKLQRVIRGLDPVWDAGSDRRAAVLNRAEGESNDRAVVERGVG